MRRPRWSLLVWLLALATCHPDADPGAGPSLQPGSLSLQILTPALAPVPATSGVARLTGAGVDISRTLGPGQSVSVEVPPGSYTLVLAGLAEGAVVSLGRREDIVVRAGAETEATVQLQPFVPDPPQAPVNAPAGEAITVRWNPVPGASLGYQLEWSPTVDFGSGVQRGTTDRSSLDVTLPTEGVYFFRVRALTDAVSAPGRWSDPSAGTGAVEVDPPVIRLSPTSVAFTGQTGGTDPIPQTVAVTNAGGGTLDGLTAVVTGYGGGQPTGWLSASMNGGAAPAEVRLTPEVEGLEAGSYTATVEVRSSDPDVPAASLTVTLVLTTGAAPPSIRLNVTRRAFAAQVGGENPEAQFVQVSNGGDGVLEGLALTILGSGAPPDGWLTATLDATAAPATITLQPDIRGLAVGRYTSTLRVSGEGADNSPQSVIVTLNVMEAPPPPSIRLSLDSVAFEAMEGQEPAPRSVQVENSGTGVLERLSVDVVDYGQGVTGWLTAEISGSTAPATVTLQASTDGLDVGTYSALVEVASPQADNNPQAIPVTLTVTPGPAIGLSTGSVTFSTQEGSDPADQSVTITNAGEGTLDGLTTTVGGYTGGATGWLDAALSATTAPSTLTLGVAAAGLAPGDYSATVEVASAAAGNSPRSVTVTLSVAATPPDTFTVALSASPTAGGTVSGSGRFVEGSSVTVVATANSGYRFTRWTEGGTEVSTSASYTFTLTGDRTLVAVFTPDPDPLPAIGLSTGSVAFTTQEGSNPADQSVTITNAGDGILGGLTVTVGGYTGGATGWLDALLSGTTAPSILTLGAAAAGLAPGDYSAIVEVASTAAVNSPQSVTVTLTVTPAPPNTFTVALTASPTAGGTVSGSGSFVEGSSVTVVATANSGYSFTRWTEGGTEVSTSASYTFTLTGDRTLVAVFTLDPVPAIGLSTESVAFSTEEGADPADQTVTITNTGDGTLDGLTATVGSYTGGVTGWLDTALSATTAPSTLTLGAAAAGLAPGDYSAIVEVASAAAVNSPRSITVTLSIAATAPDTFTVALSASPTEGGTVSGGGSFEEGSSVTVVATANSGYSFTRWTEGGTEVSTSASYTFTLTGDRTLVAVFTRNPNPAIGLSADSVAFTTREGSDPPAQTVRITNVGGGNLAGLRVSVSGYTGGSGGWLDASLSSGSAPSTLTLETDDADDLDPGVYTATVEIASSQATNSPQVIIVTLTVTAEASSVGLTVGVEAPERLRAAAPPSPLRVVPAPPDPHIHP